MSAPKKLLNQRAKEASVATSASLEPKQSSHKGFVPLVCASSHGKLLSETAMKHKSKGNKAPYKDLANVLPSPGYKAPTRIQDMNFAEKVHHMLSDLECLHFIAWMPHGRAFKVVVPELFEIHVCPRYFGHKRYALFRCDLEDHGFRYICSGRDRNCYYHECMLKYRVHLCKLILPRRGQEAKRRSPVVATMASCTTNHISLPLTSNRNVPRLSQASISATLDTANLAILAAVAQSSSRVNHNSACAARHHQGLHTGTEPSVKGSR